jgi:hypothetical protein
VPVDVRVQVMGSSVPGMRWISLKNALEINKLRNMLDNEGIHGKLSNPALKLEA